MDKQNMHLKEIRWATVALLALAAFAACGYQFKGMGLSAPQGVQSIAIPVLENRTSESGIETVFTSDLAYEFTRSKVLSVVDKNRADAVLNGTIRSAGEETISHTARYHSAERRVTITLNLTLMCRDGRVLWSDTSLSDREAFEVSGDKLTTEKNRRTAIKIISERLAEKIHNRILQDF
jgi:outer membrane lipopolysaccharide assembly protein LptE/RlpB